MMELLYLSLFVLFVFYMKNRVINAINQIRFEEAIRESVRQAKQKRKIDELYGRDK